jgi:hypothetical protein
MGNTQTQTAEHNVPANNDDLQLHKIIELLQRMDDPQIFDQTLSVIKITDPEFLFLTKISGDTYAELEAKFLNMIPQIDFNHILNTHRQYLSKKVLTLLSAEKLKSWYWYSNGKCKDKHVSVSECALIGILVSKGLMPERLHLILLNAYLQGKCDENSGSADYYETLETILMICGDKIEIDVTLATNIKVTQIVAKYFQNKARMLQLECDTKESCIRNMERTASSTETEP